MHLSVQKENVNSGPSSSDWDFHYFFLLLLKNNARDLTKIEDQLQSPKFKSG
jgi:hypothetical protein